ncbi:MAG: hypothetical protein AB4206_20315 [Xenococcaceae cyanobacterium]
MANSLLASEQGLEIIDRARRKKGWNKDAPAWIDAADDMDSYTKAFNYYLQALTITRKIKDIKGEEKILIRLSSKIYLPNLVLHRANQENKSENDILLELCKICCAIGDYETAKKLKNLNLFNLQINPPKKHLNLGDNLLSIEYSNHNEYNS